MAVLPDATRQAISERYMASQSKQGNQLDMLASDVREAVDANDDYMQSTQAAANSALPAVFKENATIKQKSELSASVNFQRYEAD